MLPTRDEAEKLLSEHVKEDYQILHAKMVAAAMEAYADKFGEDKELWYLTGLLHDLDYYEYPDEHPGKSLEWFKDWGYPEELIHAVEAHAHGYNGYTTEPQTRIAAALIACDELSGLIYAYSLMRPEGMKGMEPKGIKKRFKDKDFAAKISRDEINYGIEKLETEFADHAKILIDAFNNMEVFK